MSKKYIAKSSVSAKNNITSVKNIIAEQLPPEVWLEVFQHLHIYDIILFRSCCKEIRQLVKEIKPFGPTFALNQAKFVEHFALNGYTSCLEYLMSIGFDIDFKELAELVASVGKTQNHINVLKLCEKQGIDCNKARLATRCAEYQCCYAMLKYLCSSLSEIQAAPSYFWPSSDTAARHGHYDCMKLLIDLGFGRKYISYTPSMKCWQYFVSQKYPWPKKATFLEDAAAEGNLQMLKLGFEHGAPKPTKFQYVKTVECLEFITENTSCDIDDCVINAIKRNNIEVIKYFIKTRYITKINAIMEKQAMSASKEMYQLLMKLPFDGNTGGYNPATMHIGTAPNIYSESESPYVQIIGKNDLDTLKFALEKWPLDQLQGEKCFQRAIFYSANDTKNDNIGMIRLLFEKFKLNANNSMAFAAKYGSVKVLEFLTENGAQWTAQHLQTASQSGQFEALVYLYKIGCPWTSLVCDKAGSLMCLKYAREHGCSWTKEFWAHLFANLQYRNMKSYHAVKMNVNIPMLCYALWNGCPMDEHTHEDVKYLSKHHPELNIHFKSTQI